MQLMKAFILLACGLSLGACGQLGSARKAASSLNPPMIPVEVAVSSLDWTVADVRVSVPKDLKVSEANSYYPLADIVWRGDPFGDRYAQIGQIMDKGLTRGLDHLLGGQAVIFDIKLRRFHSLTPKARHSVGGVHNIIFDLEVRDAATELLLHDPVKIELNLRAYGGTRAIVAAGQGHSPKTRILSHLTNTMRRQFGGITVRPTAGGDPLVAASG